MKASGEVLAAEAKGERLPCQNKLREAAALLRPLRAWEQPGQPRTLVRRGSQGPAKRVNFFFVCPPSSPLLPPKPA